LNNNFKKFINVASASPSIISTQNNLTSQSSKRKASFNVENSDSDESEVERFLKNVGLEM
jgi:hypothetical protein